MATSSQERSQAEAHTRSRTRRYKATNMAFEEMVGMVAILRREDYDGKHGPYKNPNKLKAQIMDNVKRSIRHKFGVHRSREQLHKRWFDLKLRELEQMERIKKVIRRSK